MDSNPTLEKVAKGNALALCAAGPWTAPFAPALERMVAEAEAIGGGGKISIDVSQVSRLDTFGAWLIERLRRSLTNGGVEPPIAGLSAAYASLVNEVRRVQSSDAPTTSPLRLRAPLEQIGRSVVGFGDTMVNLVAMTGAVTVSTLRLLRHPLSFRLTSTVHHLEQVCWRAVPIVVLITFLIGCIVAQQGIFHFRKFGADVFVVDMLGVLVLRELGVLLVAIMVAGRSGSAYTAELGSMKMREEIDALSTMGLDPVEVLILPRIIALVIALPILAFIGSMAALYGGLLTAWFYGGMQPSVFIARLHEAVSLNSFQVGMWKAPFMALVIGIVACSEGLRVKGSAESLGLQTTTSVVKSIFLVIVLDGLFAVFFASIGM